MSYECTSGSKPDNTVCLNRNFYKLLNLIKDGTYQRPISVYIAKNVNPNERENKKVCIKRYFKCKHEFYNELNILAGINHKNIISLIDFVSSWPVSYISLELAIYSSQNFFTSSIFNEEDNDNFCNTKFDQCLFYLKDLFSAINYIHRINIYHNYINDKHVRIDQNLNIKIIGFNGSFSNDVKDLTEQLNYYDFSCAMNTIIEWMLRPECLNFTEQNNCKFFNLCVNTLYRKITKLDDAYKKGEYLNRLFYLKRLAFVTEINYLTGNKILEDYASKFSTNW